MCLFGCFVLILWFDVGCLLFAVIKLFVVALLGCYGGFAFVIARWLGFGLICGNLCLTSSFGLLFLSDYCDYLG